MNIYSLQKLSVRGIEQDSFPLQQLLKDSLFYPSCGTDGELIRYCNLHFSQLGICSFIYVDYAMGEDRLLEFLHDFRGYHLFANRQLTPGDVGADKQMMLPDYIDPDEYFRYQEDWNPFAHWAVLERDNDFGEGLGPKRFSLLFLGAEGVAAYAGLYLNNGITPKSIALIQPGHAFGLNWTNYFDRNAPLARTVFSGDSLPDYLFYGGLCLDHYYDCPWPGYLQIDRVNHYYSATSDSAMTVWKCKCVKLKVYDGSRADNYGITLQVMDNARTLPHSCNHVYVEYGGIRYEATIGVYRQGNTLRGASTIKALILQNHWQPGKTFLYEFVAEGDTHLYRFILID